MRDLTERQWSGRPNRIHRNSLIRKVLMAAGTFFVGLGIVGIFLPILPTTPFLLLAAACYARSSERFYNWLLNHRWFAKYIRPYREGKGIPLKAKALSVSLIWLTILFSVIFVVHPLIVRVILIVIAMGVTIYLLSLPTLRE
ncbi:MAG: YbaN family protein [Thermodesulfobacteriota bacterium]|nr:YbaN family protein [Thermodesulfobacteriota bacterium]